MGFTFAEFRARHSQYIIEDERVHCKTFNAEYDMFPNRTRGQHRTVPEDNTAREGHYRKHTGEQDLIITVLYANEHSPLLYPLEGVLRLLQLGYLPLEVGLLLPQGLVAIFGGEGSQAVEHEFVLQVWRRSFLSHGREREKKNHFTFFDSIFGANATYIFFLYLFIFIYFSFVILFCTWASVAARSDRSRCIDYLSFS